jgi:hypothetical protein
MDIRQQVAPGPLQIPRPSMVIGIETHATGRHRIIPCIGQLADGTGLAMAQDRHRNEPIGAQEDAMTTTADSTRTYVRADREGRPCQFPVIAVQAQDRAGAVGPLAADATGALEAVPECPAFPHLPADIQHALADFDARVADGRLPMAADGYPASSAAAEAWVADFLRSRMPTEI